MTECMSGATGYANHYEDTEAMYRVQTSESFAESYWCAECLLNYIGESGMGECVQFVGLMREPKDKEAQDQHAKVAAELAKLGKKCERP